MPGRKPTIDVLVVGEINPDIIVSDPDPTPSSDEVEKIVQSVHMTIGSSSAIFACGAARLGFRVAYYGVVGDDTFGRYMLAAMAERGVDISACEVDRMATTGASVILSSGQDRAILTAMGNIGAMDVRRVPQSLLDRARHIHSGCFYLQETSRSLLPAFFAKARSRGITTSFDTNWDPSGEWDGGVADMIRSCDIFFPNAAEVTRIAQREDIEDAARTLAKAGHVVGSGEGPLIVVKRGRLGALACRSEGPIARTVAMPVDPLDTTGAGDSFNAGFLRAWLDGGSIYEALRLGAACGALSTLKAGGVDGQPTYEDALAAHARWNP